jgi:hypothetical protein
MPIVGQGAVLGAALKAAVDQVTATATASGSPVNRDAMFNAMGEAIVAFLLANGDVIILTGAGAPGTGHLL